MSVGLVFTLFTIPPQVNKQNIMGAETEILEDKTQTVTSVADVQYITSRQADSTFVIGTFAATTTKIAVRPATEFPANLPILDEWIDSITVDGKPNRAKLAEYLIFTDVPETAEFVITETTNVWGTGVLIIKIKTTKTMVDGVIQDVDSDLFTITLNLTPRVTVMSPIMTGYPNNLTPAALKTRLFNPDGLVIDQTELLKYITIKVPVKTSNYYLVEDSWNPNAGDGTVSFSIYAGRYYDSEGAEKNGSSSIIASQVKLNLQLQRSASSIAIKTIMPNVRVDKFANYVKNNGSVVDRTRLVEFLDLINVPSDAIFTINTLTFPDYDENFSRKLITFDLTIDKFNQGSQALPSSYTETLTLTLDPQHKPTTIVKRTEGDINFRVDRVAEQLNTLKGNALINYLTPWITFESLPEKAVISTANVTPVSTNGTLSFNVVASTIYDNNSDEITSPIGRFAFTLQFGIKHPETKIVQNYMNTPRVDDFANSITNLKTNDLYDYLSASHLIMTSVMSEYFSAWVLSQNNATGEISFKVALSKYYDVNSDLITRVKEWSFTFTLTPVYPATTIVALPPSVYPNDLTVTQFKARLIADGATNSGDVYSLKARNILFLKKYIKFQNIPNITVYSFTFHAKGAGELVNQVSFHFTLSNYYNENGDLVSTNKNFDTITLTLSPDGIAIRPETKIISRPDADVIDTSNRFIKNITNADGSYNLEELAKFVDGIYTIPLEGNIITITKNSVADDGTAYFTLKVSYYYDGINPNPQSDGVYTFTVRTTEINYFPWWWIGVAAGVTTFLGFTWLAIRRVKQRRFNAKAKVED